MPGRTTPPDYLRDRRFGRLTVVRETDARSASGHIAWLCRCRCGREVQVLTCNLTSGNTLSCGCWQQEVSSRPNALRGR